MFNRKTILISLLLAATALTGTVFLVNGPMRQLSIAGSEPHEYTALIDKDHPLIPTTITTRFAFDLHGGGNLGTMTVSDDTCISMDLPEGYEDYLFSWTATSSKYFLFRLDQWAGEYTVQGKKRTLYSLPGAYKIEFIYANPDNLNIGTTPDGWAKSSETVGEDTKVTFTKGTQAPFGTNWSTCTYTPGTYYVRSIKFWYTC